MSTQQFLMDAATRHQVFLQRYGNGRSKEAVKLLNRLRKKINARLAQEPTDFQAQRLQDVLKDVDSLTKLTMGDIKKLIQLDALEFAASETEFTATMLNRVSSVTFALPAEAALIAAVETTPMSIGAMSGVTIPEALTQFGVKKGAQILQEITDGVLLGDTTPSIARKLDTIIRTMMKRQANTLVSTIINAVSSIARNKMYEQNERLIDRYEWVSTLDGRTTFVCMARDGKLYRVNEGPMPPAHYGCRSTTIPKVKKEFDLGLDLAGTRPSIGSSGVKQVSDKLTYGGWLKTQSREFVDEALGIERSRLFRSGKLPIGKFVDPTGRVYTLQQLRDMNPLVFADLTP